MKVVLNYDPTTGQITDSVNMHIIYWMDLNYEPFPENKKSGSRLNGDQLIRVMKIAAHIEDADKVTDL